MRGNDCLGIVFPNVHDDVMSEMTVRRSMGSVPFAARYRMIDFTLSLLVNAGISKVGVLARANYRSLMDHLGSGKSWDLDRKSGGLFILPPFAYGEGIYTGHIDALDNASDFIGHSTQKYVVLCDCDVVMNFPLEEMIERHIETGADVTVAYKHGTAPEGTKDITVFKFDRKGRAKDILITGNVKGVCDHSLKVMVMEREKLLSFVADAVAHSQNSISRDILQANIEELDIRGYRVETYAEVMTGMEAYVKISNRLLSDRKARDELFCHERPIFTKTRDDMPTKYGLRSSVSGCMIGDGCIIEGKVKNSVIFRGVHIAEGAVVENCIIMQDSTVGENAEIRNVTLDKNVTVNANVTLCGSPVYPMYIRKGATV